MNLPPAAHNDPAESDATIVQRVGTEGWSVEETAEAFAVSAQDPQMASPVSDGGGGWVAPPPGGCLKMAHQTSGVPSNCT